MTSVKTGTGLIDTHVHLEDEAFASDREAVLERAEHSGIVAMVNAGSTVAANREAFKYFKDRKNIFFGVGLHPHEFPGTSPESFIELRDQLSRDKVVALGEIGLDYHVFPDYPAPDRAAQQQAFSQQLEIARIFELPVIVHVREADEDALRLLEKAGPFHNGGVMHCYSGGMTYLSQIMELGFHIGVGGPLTYPKSQEIREVVRQVPIKRLLLETDCPYLPPQSNRGKRNEPAYLAEVAQAVAEVRGITVEALMEQTSANARKLFKLDSGTGRLVYEIKGHLYINLTNRCSADCTFCPRHTQRQVQTYDLTLEREPSAAELIAAMGDPTVFSEVVFCGFGEPLLRLTTLLEVARVVKAKGGRTRVDTNGHADVIYQKDILPQCKGLIDEWSVSLNSSDEKQYDAWVRPAAGQGVYSAVQAFIGRAVQAGFPVTVTAVEMPAMDVEKLKTVCHQLGARYRGRAHQRLGTPEDVRCLD
ncbi:YchF/TatD family DNA exonuclease [bacterium]|nr:YchF/TatD family DNA exonuclease [bacterium]